MDWTDPTQAMIPTLDGAVLAVLATVREPLTGRAVARLARRGSVMGISRALARLEEQGLVDGFDAGPSRLYRLNRDHVAAPAAAALADLRTTVLRRIRDHLAAWEIPPVSAALFGSVARGDATTGSDVDLVLVRPDAVADDDVPWASAVFDLADRIHAWTGNRASMLQATQGEVDDMVARQAPIVQSLTADAIDLAGAPIRDLLHPHSAA